MFKAQNLYLFLLALTLDAQIELTSPAASEQSRADCEAICKLGLKAKVGLFDCEKFPLWRLKIIAPDFDTYPMPYG